MGVTTVNLVFGPARLYVAPFGATEPADSAVVGNAGNTPPGGLWTDVGGTDGGIDLEIDSTYVALVVDQLTMPAGQRLTDLKMTVTAKLSEITLNNINTALNTIATQTLNSGYSTLGINVGASSTQPNYAALIIDGWAPYLATGPALRRSIVRKVVSQTKVGLMADKKTQQGIACSWEAQYVSSSILPVWIVDQQS